MSVFRFISVFREGGGERMGDRTRTGGGGWEGRGFGKLARTGFRIDTSFPVRALSEPMALSLTKKALAPRVVVRTLSWSIVGTGIQH